MSLWLAKAFPRFKVWKTVKLVLSLKLNSYPEWRDIQFAPNNHYGFFFLHTLASTIAFRLEYVLVCRNNYIFQKEKCLVRFLRCWRWNDWQKLTSAWRQTMQNDVKTSESTSWHHAQESSYTPSSLTLPRVRRHFLVPVGIMEIPVGYARKIESITGDSKFPTRGSTVQVGNKASTRVNVCKFGLIHVTATASDNIVT